MSLDKSSLLWAIDSVSRHSDSDLFPRVPEFEAIRDRRDDFSDLIAGKPLASFTPGIHRRFIVPKDEFTYRQATQLDPQDSIILAAAIYEYGKGIEDRRLDSTQVFSYRFSPSDEHGLYSSRSAWNNFYSFAQAKSGVCERVLYCDIADFYNQIYHHTVENQLIASSFPNQVTKWLINLLESTTAGVSRGVPIGPHPMHLIAEASLIPIDNCLKAVGLDFCRYADDLFVFCDSDKAARHALASVVEILDKQQRLMLQQHKTKIYEPSDFASHCSRMIEDRPISEEEDEVLQLIRKYSDGDPYATILFSEIDDEDWRSLDESVIGDILQDYMSSEPVDYVRLRWFFRRLTQIGHPGAIEASLDNIETLGPCFANICQYLASVQAIETSRWKSIGGRLLDLLENDQVKSSEFFRLSIMSLFSRNGHINHFASLSSLFGSSDPFARREILLAARASGADDWLRMHKEDFDGMEPWQRNAYVFCAARLPQEERKYFLNRFGHTRPFQETLAKWSKSK